MARGLLVGMLLVIVLVQSSFAMAQLGEGSSVKPVRILYPTGPLDRARTYDAPSISSQDTLIEVSQLYPMGGQSIAFGDTDYDNRFEAIFYWRDQNWEWHYVILEEQGSNVYTEEYVGAELEPYTVGDLDEDGKAEIVGQFGYFIQVYESVDATSYPTQLVWSSPSLSNVLGFMTTGDTDRDGNMEIIHSVNFAGGNYLYIFENTGDNSFAQVFGEFVAAQHVAAKVVADLDGDGLIEIAFCGLHGWLHVYESPADNTWIETDRDTTGLRNAYAAVGGVDTDGNGTPELFVAGEGDADFRKQTIVYEAVADNQFARVATLLTNEFGAGGSSNALGDFKGTGELQYVTRTTDHLWFYEATAIGEWTVCSQMTNQTHSAVQTFDVNRNGKSELFWDSFQFPTLVLEYPPRTSGVGPFERRGLEMLILSPNPCRARATVFAQTGSVQAEWLTVYDVAGRLVERRSLRNGQAPLVWYTNGLSAGMYFLQLENHRGIPVARGRGITIR